MTILTRQRNLIMPPGLLRAHTMHQALLMKGGESNPVLSTLTYESAFGGGPSFSPGSIALTAGNLVVAAVAAAALPNTITDTAGNTWVPLTTTTQGPTLQIRLFYCLAGPGTTGTRTLAQYGVCTALKVDTTLWIISGTGLT